MPEGSTECSDNCLVQLLIMGLVVLSKWLTCVVMEAHTDPSVLNGTDFGL